MKPSEEIKRLFNHPTKDEIVVTILNSPRNNPALLKNILEAIDAGTQEDQETLQDYLDQKEFKLFGLKAYAMSIDYQENMAESIASSFFNQSLTGEL